MLTLGNECDNQIKRPGDPCARESQYYAVTKLTWSAG